MITLWPLLRELLGRAVAKGRGEVEVDDILRLVELGRMHIGVLCDDERILLALAAEVVEYPRRKILNLAFAGGDGASFVAEHYMDELDSMARQLGADGVQFHCQPSMARMILKARPDAEQAYIVVERRVA